MPTSSMAWTISYRRYSLDSFIPPGTPAKTLSSIPSPDARDSSRNQGE
jgi:hypothetical protein